MAIDRMRARLRTQMVALVAWMTGEASLGVALYPAVAAAVLVLLASAVLAFTVRWSPRAGLMAATAAAVPFTLADVVLNGAASIATVQEIGAHLLLGLGLIFASAPIGASLSWTVSQLRADASPAGHERRLWSTDALVCERDAGGHRAEWELARAAEYGREVTLALVGVDLPAREDDPHAERTVMRRLDDVILGCVTRFDVLSEYGCHERLLILPEESAVSLAGGAAEICTLASGRVGRPVRMALAGFPAQGRTLRGLLTELEIDLADCRARGASVILSGAAPAGRPSTVSLRPLSRELRAPATLQARNGTS